MESITGYYNNQQFQMSHQATGDHHGQPITPPPFLVPPQPPQAPTPFIKPPGIAPAPPFSNNNSQNSAYNRPQTNYQFTPPQNTVVVQPHNVHVQDDIHVYYEPPKITYENKPYPANIDTQTQFQVRPHAQWSGSNGAVTPGDGQRPGSAPTWEVTATYQRGDICTAGNGCTYRARRETTGEGPWSHTAPGSPYGGNNPAWERC